jgi:hypothetical protein
MSYDDKFPPNRFLKKHMTPGRLILAVVALVALELIGGKYFPHQLATGAMCLLLVWMPFAVIMMIWQVVWYIRHPRPKREECPTCHQLLPEKDNE